MNKEQIKTVLRGMAGEPRPLGVVHLHLHGSQVGSEARPESDIDLAASFYRAKVRTALDARFVTDPAAIERVCGRRRAGVHAEAGRHVDAIIDSVRGG